mmetsp:Transcript_75076/g.162356  ORF Transcript_75076/g.162356 Transcript_75076/m.162356 type:complete len:252 (+) Transcript_75076:670-1425(+)
MLRGGRALPALPRSERDGPDPEDPQHPRHAVAGAARPEVQAERLPHGLQLPSEVRHGPGAPHPACGRGAGRADEEADPLRSGRADPRAPGAEGLLLPRAPRGRPGARGEGRGRNHRWQRLPARSVDRPQGRDELQQQRRQHGGRPRGPTRGCARARWSRGWSGGAQRRPPHDPPRAPKVWRRRGMRGRGRRGRGRHGAAPHRRHQGRQERQQGQAADFQDGGQRDAAEVNAGIARLDDHGTGRHRLAQRHG